MISTSAYRTLAHHQICYQLPPTIVLRPTMQAINQLMCDLKEKVVAAQTSMERYEDWLKTAGLDKKKHQIQGMDFCIQREPVKNPME